MDTIVGVLIILLLFALRFALPLAVTVLFGRLTERLAQSGA